MSMMVIWGFLFLIGLVVGSFLNVVVYRMLHGDSPFRGRSQCPKCKKQIAWYDNVPLMSFLFLRGRCRYCKAKISWRYPVLELLTGLLFIWWFEVGQFFFRLTLEPYKTIQPVFWLMVGISLVSLFVADLWFGLLPDVFTVGLSVLAFLYRFSLTVAGIMQLTDFLGAIACGVIVSGFFTGLILITRGKGMGWGDVKYGLAMGLVLGWPKMLVGLFFSFLTGAILGIILIMLKKKRFGQTIPFGPFLIAGTVVALVWGEMIWNGYMRMMGL